MRRKGSLVLAIVALAVACAWAAQQLNVQVKETQLRAKASFLGTTVATLGYGAQVTVLQDAGAWVRVRSAAGKEGWVHRSALTERKIKLAAGQKNAAGGASGDEVALAGKGFSEDVEAVYKEQNAELDYSWVDRMAQWTVDAAAAEEFLAAGAVVPNEGGRP